MSTAVVYLKSLMDYVKQPTTLLVCNLCPHHPFVPVIVWAGDINRSWASTSSSSHENISLRLSIDIARQSSEQWAICYNSSHSKSVSHVGAVPTAYKSGIATSLHRKPGLDTGDFKNFCPITNLTTASKILERLALSRLKPYIKASPNYRPIHSAYRAAHSTETAMVKDVDDVLRFIDAGSAVVLVGLDISAACDMVKHNILLDRLEQDFGISGILLQWLLLIYPANHSVCISVGRHRRMPWQQLACIRDQYWARYYLHLMWRLSAI